MQSLSIQLEDWQQEALREMAEARGLGMQEMAQSLLSERLMERIHCAFDDLLSGTPILLGAAPNGDTIEQRLRRLFEE